MALLLVGAFVLYHVLPPTEKEQLAHKNLENGRPVVGLKSRAVDENRPQSASRGSSGKLKIEVQEEAAEEKSGPEEEPALDVERRPAETFERPNEDDPSIDTWSVQVAAFRDESDAEMLADRLKQKRYETFIVSGERWHRVLVGEFVSFKEAGQVKDSLAQEQEFDDAFVRKG
ncbi:MAG: SPOR domain-containing protein [Candidatus Binatia bacterium]